MSIRNLNEIADISMGQAPDGASYNFDNNGYPLIAGAGDFGSDTPSPKKFTTLPTRISKKGDIILCVRATIGDLNWSDRDYCLGRGVAGIRPDLTHVDPKYLWFALQSQKTALESQGTGSTFKQVSRKAVESVKIFVPPLPKQRRIASILEKADAIRRKRHQAIDLMNDFLRSVFLEMFGDLKSNSKNWELVPFGSLGECRLGKMLDGKKQTGEFKRPYLRNANVQWNRFALSDLLEMDFSIDDRVEFSLRPGDVLICEGGEVGRAAIWQNQIQECYFQKALHRMRLHPNSGTPEFLVFLMWELARSGGLKDHTTSATIAHLTGVKLKAIPVIKPPIERQRQFSKMYYAAEKCLATLHNSKIILESCMASFAHDFFQGN